MKQPRTSVVTCSTSLFCILLTFWKSNVTAVIDFGVPDIFYPFGIGAGDDKGPINKYGSNTGIPIDAEIPFVGSVIDKDSKLYVNTPGILTFGTAYTGLGLFPSDLSVIAPFWSNISTTVNNGSIFFRQSTNAFLLNRTTQDIRDGSFTASWIFIATWQNVTYSGGSDSTPVNTFQVVLATDGNRTFAMFNYGDMNWSKANGSGTPSKIGYSFSSGMYGGCFVLPLSRTSNILKVQTGSNAKVAGRWLFEIDSWLTQSPSGDFDCECFSPCKSKYYVDGTDYYGSINDPTKYFQCSTDGTYTCYGNNFCPRGLTWSQNIQRCDYPPASANKPGNKPGSSDNPDNYNYYQYNDKPGSNDNSGNYYEYSYSRGTRNEILFSLLWIFMFLCNYGGLSDSCNL